MTEIESPFPVEYKLVWAKHHSRWQIDISTFEKVSNFYWAVKRKLGQGRTYAIILIRSFFFRRCYMLASVCQNPVTIMMLINLWMPCWIAEFLAKNTFSMKVFRLLRAKRSNCVKTFFELQWWTCFCMLILLCGKEGIFRKIKVNIGFLFQMHSSAERVICCDWINLYALHIEKTRCFD